MNAIDDILLRLNTNLEDEVFNLKEFHELIRLLKEKFSLRKGVLLDFEFFNEKRLRKARREFLKAFKLNNLDYSESQHEIVMICLDYQSLKIQLALEKSKFTFEESTLKYFYLGTAKNDQVIREYLVYKSDLWI